MTKKSTMKPCPFCSKPVDLEDADVLYPNGSGYEILDDGMYSYKSFREVPPEQWCWSIHCPVSSGGCGAQLSGDSKQETTDKWNRRAT